MRVEIKILAALLIGLAVGGAIGYSVAPPAPVPEEKKPVKIGSFLPLTGTMATAGYRIKCGIELGVDEINARGGVLGGRPLQVIIEDDQTKVDKAVEAVHKLMDVDKVCLILGGEYSAATIAVAPICLENHIPQISITATSPDNRPNGPYHWSVIALDTLMGRACVNYAYEEWGSLGNVGILVMNDPYGVGIGKAYAKAVEDLGGKVVAHVLYEIGKPDYRAEVERLFAQPLDNVFVVLWENEARMIHKQAYELGYYETVKGHWYCSYISDVLVATIPETVEELKGTDPTFGSPRGAAFVKRIQAKYPDLVLPGYYPCKGYDALQVAVQAINLCNSDDPEKINEVLPVAFEMVVGVSDPSLRVDADGIQTDEYFAKVVYRGGQIVQVGTVYASEE